MYGQFKVGDKVKIKRNLSKIDRNSEYSIGVVFSMWDLEGEETEILKKVEIPTGYFSYVVKGCKAYFSEPMLTPLKDKEGNFLLNLY